jgi:hypothetical protein
MLRLGSAYHKDFKPHLQHWPQLKEALARAGSTSGLPPGVPKFITVRGTVSKIVEAPPNATEHWVDIFFQESPDGQFDVCALGPDVFSDLELLDMKPDMPSRRFAGNASTDSEETTGL